jgi:tetratricopeptide (TPR) repeat protein
MASLVLDVSRLAGEAGWEVRWRCGEELVYEPFRVEGAEAGLVWDAGQFFHGLFGDGKGRPITDAEGLRKLGELLHEAFFAPARQAIDGHLKGGGKRHHLLIRSTDPDLLNLPFELVELEDRLPLGSDKAWALCRGAEDLVEGDVELPAGPLRVVFLTAAPRGQAELFFEREEDAMLTATARAGRNVQVVFAELGTVDELDELVTRVEPHVVHLSGHGKVVDGVGSFAFEDERGNLDFVPAPELVRKVFRGVDSVRCVLVNGCETAQAAVVGLCQSLTASGVPIALGWSAPVADDLATDFTAAFYGQLASGAPVARAAAAARGRIEEKARYQGQNGVLQDATFALLQVYAGEREDGVFDRSLPAKPYQGPGTQRTTLGDGIEGLTTGFVGRRRKIQELLPPLREGEITAAVLTGLGGAGKSTLATRVANHLEGHEFKVVPIGARKPEDEPSDRVAWARKVRAKVIQRLADEFLLAGRQDLADRIQDGQISAEQRLRIAAEALTEMPLLLVLDNLEDCQLVEEKRIADPALSEFYAHLLGNLTRPHGARVLVTTRWLPAETPDPCPCLLHVPLEGFPESDFLKFLRNDEVVERRMMTGELPRSLVQAIHKRFGGTPRFLDQIRHVLRDADPQALEDEVKGVAEGELEEKREAYLGSIFTARLYEALGPGARRLVSRLAVSLLPVPEDGVALLVPGEAGGVGGLLREGVGYGLVEALRAPEVPDLYQVPGLLQGWLTEEGRLGEGEETRAHGKLAGFWKESLEKDRERELRVSVGAELVVCREHARSGEEGDVFAWATVRMAGQLERTGEWKVAEGLLDEVPEGDRTAEVLQMLGKLALNRGSYPEARGHYVKALGEVSDQREEAIGWHQLATIDLKEGKYSAAREGLSKSLEIKQEIGDRAGEAASWHQLATIDVYEGKYSQAREGTKKSLEIEQEIGNRAGEAASWHQLASIDLNEGKYSEARAGLSKSLEIRQEIGDRAGEAASWHQLATIDLEEGKYSAAREGLSKSLLIDQEIGNRAGEAASWALIGVLLFRTGQFRASVTADIYSIGLLQVIGSPQVQQVLPNLLGAAEDAGLDEEQLQAAIETAAEEYGEDRGRGFLEQVMALDMP